MGFPMAARDTDVERSRPTSRNPHHAAAFLIAVLLPLAVGLRLYFGPLFVVTTAGAASRATIGPTAKPTEIVRATPTVGSTAPVAIAAAAVPILPPTPSPTIVLTEAVNTPVVIQNTPTPGVVITAPPESTPAAPVIGHVANTSGQGVLLRHTPESTVRWIGWIEKTPLVLLGNEADARGQHWLQVRDPNGNVGWVPAQYVAR